MKTYYAELIVLCLAASLSSCEKRCNRVVQPALYFTLVDQANNPLLPDNNSLRVTVLYNYLGRSVKDTLRLSGTMSANNSKYAAMPLLVSEDILFRSTMVDSASYELFLDKKPVGTLRLYPFRRSTECDMWTYTSGITFNGKFVQPVGPTNDVYLLPVIP